MLFLIVVDLFSDLVLLFLLDAIVFSNYDEPSIYSCEGDGVNGTIFLPHEVLTRVSLPLPFSERLFLLILCQRRSLPLCVSVIKQV